MLEEGIKPWELRRYTSGEVHAVAQQRRARLKAQEGGTLGG